MLLARAVIGLRRIAVTPFLATATYVPIDSAILAIISNSNSKNLLSAREMELVAGAPSFAAAERDCFLEAALALFRMCDDSADSEGCDPSEEYVRQLEENFDTARKRFLKKLESLSDAASSSGVQLK